MNVIDYNDKNGPHAFYLSLVKYGFGVIKNAPIPQEKIDLAYKLWYEFFSQDMERKNQYKFSTTNHDGFVSTELSEVAKSHTVKDLKEFYHYYPWGRCPDSLLDITQENHTSMSAFGAEILGWIQEYLPDEITHTLSEDLPSMIRGSNRNLLRVIHYPPVADALPQGAMRAAPHGDINLITVLPSSPEPGLQLLDKSGEWIDVPYRKDYIIVNIGDMLQECLGGYLPSTLHRVVNYENTAGKVSRLSMPLFIHPRDEVKLSDKYTAESYRQERYAELGLSDK